MTFKELTSLFAISSLYHTGYVDTTWSSFFGEFYKGEQFFSGRLMSFISLGEYGFECQPDTEYLSPVIPNHLCKQSM